MDKKVLIVDDSELFCGILSNIVGSVKGFSVSGCAGDARKAVSHIENEKPDMIILDIQLPYIDGVSFLRQILPQYPVPVIICTGHSSFAKQGLSAGAADFVIKPADYGKDYEPFRQKLISAMQNAINLRQVECEGRYLTLKKTSSETFLKKSGALILIGGSAGSTEALPKILRSFTPDMPPVAATLHMPEGYTDIFAKRLDSMLDIDVCEAKNGIKLRNGMAVIAEGAKHMRIVEKNGEYYVSSAAGDKVSGHCPSADILFGSALSLDASKIVALILTGMGSDGAKGLLKLREAGAYTLGQDEKSSVVYGMPKAAYDIGAVCRQLPLEELADGIKEHLDLLKERKC